MNNMKNRYILLLIVILSVLFMLLVSNNALAEIPTKPNDSVYCQDYAQVLDKKTITQINQWGRQLNEQAAGSQIVVVTQRKLDENRTINDYSLAIMRGWGIGNSDKNNGVLLLLLVENKKLRIEVGRGLEGALPDGKVGRIIDQDILPFLKKADYNSAIINGYLALANVVATEYGIKFDSNVDNIMGGNVDKANAESNNESWWDLFPWWAKVLIGFAFLVFLLIDWFFLGGMFTNMLIALLFMFRGGNGRNDNDSFGGGSGDGGGANRDW